MTRTIHVTRKEIELLTYTGPFPFVVTHLAVHWPDLTDNEVIDHLHTAGASLAPAAIRITLKLQGVIE